MQWSTIAYAGCTAASKKGYTSARWRSSTMRGNPPFEETESAPGRFAHASATPAWTPFFSDARNATWPGRTPVEVRSRRDVTWRVKTG